MRACLNLRQKTQDSCKKATTNTLQIVANVRHIKRTYTVRANVFDTNQFHSRFGSRIERGDNLQAKPKLWRRFLSVGFILQRCMHDGHV